jgi:hypothetical protein
MRLAGLLLLGSLFCQGCLEDLRPTPVPRASRELACPGSELRVVDRSDIEYGVFDVSGCGRVARYLCLTPYRFGRCLREPNPDPAEEAARRAVPPPPQPPRPRIEPKPHPFGGE